MTQRGQGVTDLKKKPDQLKAHRSGSEFAFKSGRMPRLKVRRVTIQKAKRGFSLGIRDQRGSTVEGRECLQRTSARYRREGCFGRCRGVRKTGCFEKWVCAGVPERKKRCNGSVMLSPRRPSLVRSRLKPEGDPSRWVGHRPPTTDHRPSFSAAPAPTRSHRNSKKNKWLLALLEKKCWDDHLH